MVNRHIVDRKLPERTRLMFYFPIPEKGGDYYVVKLPFFENVSIKEDKKARYQKYSLISRSSNLYSYLGADSRSINLTFNITLPHLLDEHPDISLDKFMPYSTKDNSNREREKKKFLQPYSTDSSPKSMAFVLGTDYTKNLALESAKQVLNSDWASSGITAEEYQEFVQSYGIDPENINPFVLNRTVVDENPEVPTLSTKTIDDNLQKQLKYRIIDLIIYWTNIIRSSVTNYSKNPIYGPPILRLRHGILYQDVPCVCTSYSIDYDEAAGYDLDTLLPRRLRFSLKLEEIRTGDFGDFDPDNANNPIKRDNLAGWEAVVLNSTHSMDPGYGGIL